MSTSAGIEVATTQPCDRAPQRRNRLCWPEQPTQGEFRTPMTSLALPTPTPARRRWRSALIMLLAGLFMVHIAGGCIAPTGGDGPPPGVSRAASLAVSTSAPAIAPVVTLAADASSELSTAAPALFDYCCDDCGPMPACCDTLVVQAPGVLLLVLLLVAGWAWLARTDAFATLGIARRTSRARLKTGLLTTLCVSRT